MHTERE